MPTLTTRAIKIITIMKIIQNKKTLKMTIMSKRIQKISQIIIKLMNNLNPIKISITAKIQ